MRKACIDKDIDFFAKKHRQPFFKKMLKQRFCSARGTERRKRRRKGISSVCSNWFKIYWDHRKWKAKVSSSCWWNVFQKNIKQDGCLVPPWILQTRQWRLCCQRHCPDWMLFLILKFEQLLCFETKINTEKFCRNKSAVFLIMPEEDDSKYFLISLIVQQLYREMLSIADEMGGKLPNRVMFFLDEFGTLPAIQSAEWCFLPAVPDESALCLSYNHWHS